MQKVAILNQFGPPDLEHAYFKNSPVIWGPIEDFWPEVPQGAKVQVWLYKSRAKLEETSSTLTAGTTELYFIDDSEFVDGIGFAPAGVVYEASD